MARNMSFSLTTEQIKNKSKTVTRRFAWWFLKPGDELCAVEKAMGLKKGEKIKRITMIRVVSVRKEPLNAITDDDCIKEGFPEHDSNTFVNMLQNHYGGKIRPDEPVNRIEFEYL